MVQVGIEQNENLTLTTDATIFPKPAFDMKHDFFDALSAGDITRAAQTFAPEGVLLFPGLRPIRGRQLVERMLGVIRRRYTDIVWEPTGPAIGSGGWVVTSWSVSGTFSESASSYENEVLSLVQLDDEGRILLLSDYFKDTLAFQPNRRGVVASRANPKHA